MSFADVMTEIDAVLPDGGQWCTSDKAHTLAAIVMSIRPRVVVEIGVWLGGSAVPMLIALRELGAGELVAIDPWAPSASVAGQDGKNAQWWGQIDHEGAYRAFCERLRRHNLEARCRIVREKSDDVIPPDAIDLLHVDGNHGEQAIVDVRRFAPHIPVGGFLVLDDLDWSGGAVRLAEIEAVSLGFAMLYPLGTGAVYQRRSWGAP